MEYKIIRIDEKDYFLVPKPKNNVFNGIEIKFEKTYTKKYFQVNVKGWYKPFEKEYAFARIENEDGSFEWEDWSTGGVIAKKEHALLLESWYKENIQNYER